jgi:hypothetical protein
MAVIPARLELSEVAQLTHWHLVDFILSRGRIDVLVVVDTEISHVEGAGFGVGRFIRVLREARVGCTGFAVDVAVRDNSPFADRGAVAAGQARYVGFRFDSQVGGQPVLDRYDEVFLFGFKPSNSGNPSDAEITQAAALPASPAELARMTAWMDAGGGVFATGDHHFLGASMCHRIPRVRSMRKWTNAQGVPPIGGRTRLDTNQPATLAQHSGAQVIPITVERDAVPQPIHWVPERVHDLGILVRRWPHEILCHPDRGPIDVMPDHPHEGCCIERSAIDATATVDFGAGPRPEYPEKGGHRERPKVIAYGDVVPDPPHQHAKGDVDPFRIAMISVYDGHRVDVGRVVTDSTWHHWMDLNLVGLEGAADTSSWEKISRYFVNVAKWIARPGAYRARCWWDVLASHFDYPGIEEYGVRDLVWLGGALRDRLVRLHGPCTVTQLVFDTICDVHPLLCGFLEERLIPRFPSPGPCLSCPPFELVEQWVIAGFVEGTRPVAERVKAALEAGRLQGLELDAAEIERAAIDGVRGTLAELASQVARSAEEVHAVFSDVARGEEQVGSS